MKRLLIYLLLIYIINVEIYTQNNLNSLKLNDSRFQNQTGTRQKYLKWKREVDQHPSTVSVGAGEIFVPKKDKVPYMANFSVNLDLEHFF
jgi:hypothetical protein